MQPTDQSGGPRLKIAVIGAGIAGMSAAWLLSQDNSVTLYEKRDRLGGHANPVRVPLLGPGDAAATASVDTGFIVYNTRNYPNLVALFDHLGVPTQASEMSFSASLDNGEFEYSGTDLNGLLGQRSNVLRPRFWRMIADVLRFYREAPALLSSAAGGALSLGDYLVMKGYGQAFIEDHLLPMGAAIWSTNAAEMRAYPAVAFIRFFVSHGLLKIRDRPQWRTVSGGSGEYVSRLRAAFRGSVRLECGAVQVRREGSSVTLHDGDGGSESFDHVVFAVHADEALALLADPDLRERSLLGAFRYTANRAVLHRDQTLMPRRPRVWSSWNYIGGSLAETDRPLCLTYWMNRLQSLDPADPLFVTLNPLREPDPDLVVQECGYTHPFFDFRALAAQGRLWQLQGTRNTWFCGSYFAQGFHEDALQSGLAVAEALGGRQRPWSVPGQYDRIPLAAGSKAASELAAA